MIRDDITISEFTASKGDFLVQEQIIPYGAVKGVVERVTKQEARNPSTKKMDKVFVLWFKGWKKGLIVSARKAGRAWLSRLWGGVKTKDWIGKAVWVYVDPSVTFGTKRVGGFRFAWGDQYSGTKPPTIPTPADDLAPVVPELIAEVEVTDNAQN